MHVNSSPVPAPQVAAIPYPWPPLGSPSNAGCHGDPHGMLLHSRQRHNSDDLSNALSFGFLATAILVSMFLVMAVFERFLRRPSSSESTDDDGRHGDVESHSETEGGKGRCFPHQKAGKYESGISVLMPGDDVPSFIAHPAPITHPLKPTPETIQCQLPAPNTSQASSARPGVNLMNSCYI